MRRIRTGIRSPMLWSAGVGDGNNSLFTLETNGTMKSATVFDYEKMRPTMRSGCRRRMITNATTEGNFSVTIIDTVDFTLFLTCRE